MVDLEFCEEGHSKGGPLLPLPSCAFPSHLFSLLPYFSPVLQLSPFLAFPSILSYLHV